jgi:lactate dehydrogenase-like 2-hydroxyacid dehydrogenase
LFKGLGKNKWRNEATELKNRSIGIIGFGTLGQLVARTAIHFGMQVFYFSRTRKNELENKRIKYLPLEDLFATCDVRKSPPLVWLILNRQERKARKGFSSRS